MLFITATLMLPPFRYGADAFDMRRALPFFVAAARHMLSTHCRETPTTNIMTTINANNNASYRAMSALMLHAGCRYADIAAFSFAAAMPPPAFTEWKTLPDGDNNTITRVAKINTRHW